MKFQSAIIILDVTSISHRDFTFVETEYNVEISMVTESIIIVEISIVMQKYCTDNITGGIQAASQNKPGYLPVCWQTH